MLTVAVLGAVEARRDGDRLAVPTGKTTELLVRLALDAGSSVRVDTLLDDLWTSGAGRNTLQSKVSQLRRALGGKALVVGADDAYRLVVEPGGVDAVRVLDLAGQASAARHAGDATTALDKASEGLRLFRGEALADAGDWAAPHRARLEDVRLGLLEDLMASRVDLGSGGELVGELERLVAEHPFRERLWASLMTALFRGGRQAEALAAYARVRRLMIEELGVEPGQDLRALEGQVLRHGAVLGGAPVDPVAAPGNLPRSLAPMVGRGSELRALGELIVEHRLVNVVGPAGVGKTRLLLEAARSVAAPGGVWLVRLDAVDRSADLEQVIAETLHVPGGAPLRPRLLGAQTVLLLDNCEHVVETISVLVESLLDDVPGLRIIATSQAPLGVEHEWAFHLEPLSIQDSVALFLARARQMRRRLVVDDDTTRVVEEVCRSLDGLPLAIELAAARARSLSVRDIARRIDDRFALLRDPSSHRPERRRALAGAIGWSYDLLFPDDQRGLWALSCFAASAPLEALEHVLVTLGVPADAVVDTLTRLVDRSLISLDVSPDGLVRYRMLDSIRAYAAQRLTDAGLAETAKRAHAAWYARTAAWCEANVRGRGQSACLTIARAERANIDAALAWCGTNAPDLGLSITTGFGWTWVVLGDGTAAAARIRRALRSTTGSAARASALLLAGWLEASAGDVALAWRDLDEADRIAESIDAEGLGADVARHRAFVALQQGRSPQALVYATASVASYRRLGLAWETAASLVLAAYGALALGDTAAAARHSAEAIDLLTPIGDSWGLVHAKAVVGGVAQAEHRFEDAIQALSGAAQESTALGLLGQAALHRASLARAQQRAGRPADAAASFRQALAAATASGDGRMASTARLNLARLLRSTGNGPAGVSLLRQNVEWYASAGGGDGDLLSRCVLAAETRDRDALEVVLALARATASQEAAILALDGLARLSAQEGDRQRATALVAEADALHRPLAHLLDDADRPDRAAALAV
ncbi:BTAD domain-containing putative transcriptional regulator [Xylanimonas ulmi]|uniref:Putative ATPase n=1 Tax=Xylanimonas ulmi TaxID=228973 RepID=A0A4V2EXV1_9MICO|nr:BTAD domain-containing putative transcriptional regulator [Xylanibacterium ulmi]RZS60770.1 putative ATPase [Xylanibacterium ulmi]